MNYFQHNLQLLQKRDDNLAALIAGNQGDVDVVLQRTQTEFPTLVVKTQGQVFALHHPSDPLSHSQQFLDSIPKWKKARNLAILGGGLGYVPFLIKQMQPKLRNLYIFEPSLSVLRAAFQSMDLSPLLSDPRIRWVLCTQPGTIYNVLLESLVDIVANPLMVIEIPSITAAFPAWAQSARQQIAEVQRFSQSGLKTKFETAPLSAANLLQNLDAIASSMGIQSLRSVFKDVPAIIVAAGPSLKKNLQQLKSIDDDMLILSTDTAFERLLEQGITPHFVITVDPTELNVRHFNAEQYPCETILLFDPESRPEFPAKFNRRLSFLTDRHIFFQWLDKELGGKGIIRKGNMVSQAGLYAADYLGCSPLILIGQDLAIDPQSGHSHVEQTAYCRQLQFIEGNADQIDVPLPGKQGQTSREKLFWVEGIDGEPVPTLQNFMVYISLLEKDIRMLGLRIINATEGGAKIPGAENMPLSKAIQQYRKKEIHISETLQEIPKQQIQKSTDLSIQLRSQFRTLFETSEQIALQGLDQITNNSHLSAAELDRIGEMFRRRLFSNQVSEFFFENGAPRELFDYMKLGFADMTNEEETEHTRKRCKLLFESVFIAKKRLQKYL